MRHYAFTLAAAYAILAGWAAPSPALASGHLVLDLLSTQAIIRSLIDQDRAPGMTSPEATRSDERAASPPRYRTPELNAQPAYPAKVEFRYDDIAPNLEETSPIADLPNQAGGNQAAPPGQIMPARKMPATPNLFHSTLSTSSVDPFFGGVVQLLGARSHQPFVPVDAIRAPGAPKFLNGEAMIVDPTGATVTPIAVLEHIADGEVLDLRTKQAGNATGRGVLLVDGRAFLLPAVEWIDERVSLQLPQLRLKQPTLARVFVARPDGVVLDYMDFVLVPR